MSESHISTLHTPVSTVETQSAVPTKPLNAVKTGRPRKHENRKSVTIYLSEAEWKWVQLQKCDLSASEWWRAIILALAEFNPPSPSGIPPAAIPTLERMYPSKSVEKTVVAQKKVKTCTHGVEKGYHCWQCRGLANVE